MPFLFLALALSFHWVLFINLAFLRFLSLLLLLLACSGRSADDGRRCCSGGGAKICGRRPVVDKYAIIFLS